MINAYAFFTYAFLTAYTPGPNNIMALSLSVRHGFRKSMPFVLGMYAGFMIVMGLCMAFCTSLYTFLPQIKPFMLVLGAAYIFHLAYKTFKSAGDITLEEGDTQTFLSGFLLQFINPKIIIYGITAMSAYILPNYASLPILVAFALLLATIGFSGSLCWTVFGSAFCKVLARYARVVNIAMGLLLVYCGVALFL